jgi:hypothetical protein
MMFQEFTWQQFLVAALVLSALWVLDELSGINAPNALNAPDDGLMGKPALEHGVSVLEADEFSFSPLEERGEREGPVARGVQGLLDELDDAQEEIKGIVRILEKEDGTKEDFFALFEVVRLKYPRLAASEMLGEMNDFIAEQVPFYLSDQELDSLWV